MKNSSTLNLKFTFFCHFQTQNSTSFLLDSEHSQLSFRVNQSKRNNQKICKKVKFDKDLNWLRLLFHDINLKNNGAILILQFSNICLIINRSKLSNILLLCLLQILWDRRYYMWLSLHKFWWHSWKIYSLWEVYASQNKDILMFATHSTISLKVK